MTTREKLLDIAVLERLKDNPDFAIFLDYLHEQVKGRLKASVDLIVTPEQQANHNYLIGQLNQLQQVIHLVDALYEKELQDLKAR